MTEEGECGVDGDCYDNEIPRLRFASLGMTYGWRGWVPASGRTTGGDGFVPASSRGWALCGRMGTGMGPRMREDNGRGWILACVFAGGGYGDGSPHARGQRKGVDSSLRLCGGGTGMGPRMREDNGEGMDSSLRLHGGGLFAGMMGVSWEGGWVPAFARTTEAGVRGWVPACARTTGEGWILACVFAGVGPVREGTGMGPRMREDNGRGWK